MYISLLPQLQSAAVSSDCKITILAEDARHSICSTCPNPNDCTRQEWIKTDLRSCIEWLTACRTELFTYERCIFYTVVTSIVSLNRMDLKAKVSCPHPGGGVMPMRAP